MNKSIKRDNRKKHPFMAGRNKKDYHRVATDKTVSQEPKQGNCHTGCNRKDG